MTLQIFVIYMCTPNGKCLPSIDMDDPRECALYKNICPAEEFDHWVIQQISRYLAATPVDKLRDENDHFPPRDAAKPVNLTGSGLFK